jgi:hypothetical protein
MISREQAEASLPIRVVFHGEQWGYQLHHMNQLSGEWEAFSSNWHSGPLAWMHAHTERKAMIDAIERVQLEHARDVVMSHDERPPVHRAADAPEPMAVLFGLLAVALATAVTALAAWLSS